MREFLKRIFGRSEGSGPNTMESMEGVPMEASRKPGESNQRSKDRDPEDTIPIPENQTMVGLNPAPMQTLGNESTEEALEPPQLIVGCAQSVGVQRDHNEDAVFCLTTVLSNDDSNMPFGLYIVADGMGGHRFGEVASDLAVRAMASSVIGELYNPLFNTKPTSPTASIQEIMSQGIQDAHRAVLENAEGGGTTITAVLVRSSQVVIAHVGDSRAYAIHAYGEMEVLTRDHSLVERLVELGQITSEEAAVHPQRNVLYRALGQGEPFEADINMALAPSGGHLLLCSDGLWGVVSEKEILEIIETSVTPQDACQKLVSAANQGGGPDNISVILIRIP